MGAWMPTDGEDVAAEDDRFPGTAELREPLVQNERLRWARGRGGLDGGEGGEGPVGGVAELVEKCEGEVKVGAEDGGRCWWREYGWESSGWKVRTGGMGTEEDEIVGMQGYEGAAGVGIEA